MSTPGSDGSTPLIRGRKPELAVVEESFSALRRGGSAVLVFEGPPGVGKSRLLREVSTRAGRYGIRAVAGTVLEGQRTCPFAVLLSALAEGEESVLAGRLARQLVATPGSPQWALHEVAAAIETAAADGPLTVVIDDLQWAHSETLAGLRCLVDGLRRSPVLWVLAVSTGWAPPLVAETLAWLEANGARRVRLGALPGPAVTQILFDVVGEPAGPVLIELTEQADGNPPWWRRSCTACWRNSACTRSTAR
ncbi:ATP-binding protein [Amycolatopsis sp. NPDC047767]|uniref:ATP-binding protein n=1 Tax=Amycolatopsis sp. NPDC047767 TaxID=3156765 RepID=UPI003451FCFD